MCHVAFYLFSCTGTSIFHRRLWLGHYELNSYSLHVLFTYLCILLRFHDYFASFSNHSHEKRVFFSGDACEKKGIFSFQANARNFLHQLFSFRQRRWKMVSFNYHIYPVPYLTHTYALVPNVLQTLLIWLACSRLSFFMQAKKDASVFVYLIERTNAIAHFFCW